MSAEEPLNGFLQIAQKELLHGQKRKMFTIRTANTKRMKHYLAFK